MELILKEDLESVDWEQLANVYRRAYGGRMSVQPSRTDGGLRGLDTMNSRLLLSSANKTKHGILNSCTEVGIANSWID